MGRVIVSAECYCARMKGLLRLLLIVPAFLLFAAGCGDDDETAPTATTPAGSSTATATPKLAPWSADTAVAIDRAAILGGDNEAWFVVNPDTGQPSRLDPITGYVPRELAHGRYDLVTTRSGTLARIDVATSEVKDIGTGWTGEISDDGKWAAIIPEVEGSTLAVVNVDSNERFELGQLGKPVMLAWSPNNTLAIVRDDVLYLAREPNWQPQRIGDFEYGWPVWSGDSQWLTVAVPTGVRLISPDLMTQRNISVPGGGVGGGGAMAWSADSKSLVVGGSSGWFVVEVDTGRVTNVAPNSAGTEASMRPSWSPDGSAIAVFVIPGEGDPPGVAIVQADGSGARMLVTGGSNALAWTDAGIFMRLSEQP